MKTKFLLFIIICGGLANAQSKQGTSSMLFWTAEKWPVKIEVTLMKKDSTVVGTGKIDYTYKGVENPSCDPLNGLLLEKLLPGSYFFFAECYKPACDVCHGEGSYWQPIVRDESGNSGGKSGKSKGNSTGTWKTCTYCKGDGQPFYISWQDLVEIGNYQCRTILLK